MAMGQSIRAWIVGLVVIVASAVRHGNGAVSCPEAIAILLPCKDYLERESATLTAPCCEAASSLDGMVHAEADLRNLCACFKQAASALHVIVDRAKALPNDCHIQVPVPIDPNVDCSRL